MNNHYRYILAQSYGEGSYSDDIYIGTSSETSTESSGGLFAPNTGLFLEAGPAVLIPTILAGAVLIATAILLIKKLIKRGREGSE